jgi:hypothetical protein
LFTHRPIQISDRLPFGIAHLSVANLEEFRAQALTEWQQIVETTSDTSVSSVFFISKAAARYRLQQQPSQNAFDVIQALVTPQSELAVKIEDFYRFMARFGPAETVMLKIQSLLDVATEREPWLYFGPLPIAEGIAFAAFDDEEEPNALVMHRGKNEVDRVWNFPMVPFPGNFIMDKSSRMYGSWKEYFRANPFPGDERIAYR